MKDHLVWKEEGRKTVFSCPIFNVEERSCRSMYDNKLKAFNTLDTPDWVMVIPVLETERGRNFVMVRQWRHGAMELSLEFPGGVFESGERPELAAAREMREETGYNARRIEKLGVFNPNPAIMSNRIHFFLALDLAPPVEQQLDEDEHLEVEIVSCEEVLAGMGKPPYIHSLVGTAICLYLKREMGSGELGVGSKP